MAVRFVVTRFPADRMRAIGETLVTSIKERLGRAQTVNDSAAPPLRPGYAKYKQRKKGSSLRDWNFQGRTLRGMRVTSAVPNRAVVSFSDPVAGMRAAVNNRRVRQFGVSPANRETIAPLFLNPLIVQAK